MWPGYVAAVASLLLSLLLLAGVLVVAISQLGRVVGSYNRQLLVELIEDERRSEEIDELGKKGQALAVATAQAKVAAAQELEQAQRRVAEAHLRVVGVDEVGGLDDGGLGHAAVLGWRMRVDQAAGAAMTRTGLPSRQARMPAMRSGYHSR